MTLSRNTNSARKKKLTMLRFENKDNQLLPFPLFLRRVMLYFFYAFILIIFSTGIGTAGYKYFGNLTWVDSFYNACMILTGMGPVNVMETNAAKLFASFYALFSGIAFLSTIAVFLAPIAHRFLHALHIKED
jgi:hypothetical protein